MKLIKVEVKGGKITTKVEGKEIEVTDAEEMGASKEAESDGYLLIDEGKAVYIAIPFKQMLEIREVTTMLLDLSNKIAATSIVEGSTLSATDPSIVQEATELKAKIDSIKML